MSARAVTGGMNKLVRYSPPFQGGVAARSRKYRAATFERADGVVAKFEKIRCASWFVRNHPVRSHKRWLRSIFLRSRPPLLGKEGNSPRFLRFLCSVLCFLCFFPFLALGQPSAGIRAAVTR